MSILRSVSSNPIEAGIKAFGDMSTILQQREEAPLRRELLAAEIADRRIRTERGQQEIEQKDKENAEWERVTGLKRVDDDTKAMLGNLSAAQVEADAAQREGREPNYTPEQQDAVFNALGKNPMFDPDKVDVQTDAIRKVRTFMRDNAPLLMQGGRLDREQVPEVFDAFDKVFEGQVNRGSDRHGNDTSSGVTKKVKSVLIDPKDGSLSFVLDVKAPVKEGQVFKHIGDGTPVFTVNPEAKGMMEPGNIDLSKRPVVRNADGSISTVRSMSVSFGEGEEVLIPLVSDSGKILTKEQAISEYQKTGRHLGKFDSSTDADAYADSLHNDPMWQKDIAEYSAPGKTETSYDAPMTFDRAAGDPNAPVVKLPAGILDQYLNVHESLGTKIQQLRAKLGPEKFAEKMETTKRTRAENKAISSAMAKVDTSKPVDDQRKAFITEFTARMPDASVKEITDLAKTIIADRDGLTSEAGKTVADRARLVTAYGEDSPQVKAFDTAAGDKRAEKGLAKTIYGPNGATKEVFIEKGKEYTPPKGWSLKAPEAGAEDRSEERRIRRTDQQSAQLERLYAGEFKAIDQSMDKDEEKKLKKFELNDEKDRALEYVQDGMSASEAKRQSRKEAGKKIKEPTAGTWKEIADQETSSAAKRYLTKEYGYSEQEAEDIIVTGIQNWYLESHPKSRISELIGRDQKRTFADDLGLVAKSKSQGKALKPLTEEVYKGIIFKAKTRGEAEEMARDMGYDHTKGYSPRKLTLREPSGPPVASAPVELPKPTSETWKEITAQGTTSKAKAFLMKKYGYSAEEAVDVIRTGFKKGYVK